MSGSPGRTQESLSESKFDPTTEHSESLRAGSRQGQADRPRFLSLAISSDFEEKVRARGRLPIDSSSPQSDAA